MSLPRKPSFRLDVLARCLGAIVLLAPVAACQAGSARASTAPMPTQTVSLRDEQQGFAGVTGTRRSIEPDGQFSVTVFVNEHIQSRREGRATEAQLRVLADALAASEFSRLPPQIGAEPAVNAHRVTLRVGAEERVLILPAGISVDAAYARARRGLDNPALRFLTIARAIERATAH